MDDNAVEVCGVSMKFRLMTEKVDSLKQLLIKRLKREIEYQDFYALNDINFKVKKGEVFGIVGLNGAGKSTLLKIIAGVLKPTSGTIRREGTIAPLLELGAGFNGDLSGVENIYLNGMLLGYSKKYLRERIDEIIDFSELGKFIHTPLKNYSSGMKARLGFSIATIVQPDTLIVDEVLSVGDFRFKEKSEQKIRSMMDNGTTVIFVSHSLSQVQSLCHRAMLLENGRIKQIGQVNEIAELYKRGK